MTTPTDACREHATSPSRGDGPHSKGLAGYLEVVDQREDNALTGVL